MGNDRSRESAKNTVGPKDAGSDKARADAKRQAPTGLKAGQSAGKSAAKTQAIADKGVGKSAQGATQPKAQAPKT